MTSRVRSLEVISIESSLSRNISSDGRRSKTTLGTLNGLLENGQGVSWIGCSEVMGSKGRWPLPILLLFKSLPVSLNSSSVVQKLQGTTDRMDDWSVRGGSVESGGRGRRS